MSMLNDLLACFLLSAADIHTQEETDKYFDLLQHKYVQGAAVFSAKDSCQHAFGS